MSVPAQPGEQVQTRVITYLEAHGVPFRLLPHSEPVFTVAAAAAQRGVNFDEMVKSILLRESGANRFVMACVRGPDRLDTQAVRACLDGSWRRLTFATRVQILDTAGYVQGAVAPLCLPDGLPVVFDRAIARCQRVNISSGDPMLGLEMEQTDLVRLVRPHWGDIAAASDGTEILESHIYTNT